MKIGVYSRKAEIAHGSLVYITPEGEEVVVTAVYPSEERANEDYGWPDKQIVGPVVHYIRHYSYGRNRDESAFRHRY